MKLVLAIVCLGAFLRPCGAKVTSSDNGYLNLVDDSFFYNFDYHKFEPKKYFRQLKEMSDSFQDCLMLNGIKKSNFEKCVGKKYVKVNRKLSRKVMEIKMNFQNDFSYRLRSLCDDKLDVVCSKLVEDLNDAMIRNQDPIKAIEDRVSTFNLKKDKLEFLGRLIKDTKKNYANYLLCEKTSNELKDRALTNIMGFIKKTGVQLDYDYTSHWAPAKSEEPVVEHKAADTRPENFNESVLALRDEMEQKKFDKANGVEDRYRALRQDIENTSETKNEPNLI